MNKLNKSRQVQVVSALVGGASINSVVRMTGVSKPTILKLLVDLGTACAKYQDEKLRNLKCRRVQADEIWSFWFAKDKNLPEKLRGKFGFGPRLRPIASLWFLGWSEIGARIQQRFLLKTWLID